MRLMLSKWFVHVLYALLSSGLIASAHADVILQGKILIGDNTYDHIEPTYMLRERGRDYEPIHPINFNLSENITLKQIKLNNAAGMDESLYFVIWKKDRGISDPSVVNERSIGNWSHTADNLGIPLAAGDYQIAVVGQCFDNGRALGWKDNCSGWGQTYDDFSFKGITLVTSDSKVGTDSLAFIQRHHIGNTNEVFGLGYGGDWYPDDAEGLTIEYPIRVSTERLLTSFTMYRYRDLDVAEYNVKLSLVNVDTNAVIAVEKMISLIPTGDYYWEINEILKANTNYKIVVESMDPIDFFDIRDDISWDDVVIKFKPDNTSGINHFRIQHDKTALTCDASSVVIQACSNDFINGNTCVEATDNTSVNLQAKSLSNGSTVFNQTYSFTGSTTAEVGHQQAETLALSLSGIAPKAFYCNNDDTGNCNITFADAGFVFSYSNDDLSSDIAPQTAGIIFNKPIKLEAFYNQRGQCKDIFTGNQSIAVNLGIQCQSPDSCTDNDFIAEGIIIGKNSSNKLTNTVPVPLSFNHNIANISPAVYEDAGQINLIAEHDISRSELDCSLVNCNLLDGLTVKGQSNRFWVKPARFIIDAIGDNGELLSDSSSTSAATYSAAKSFSLRISAVNAQNHVTNNYQPAAITDVIGKLTRIMPSTGGRDGLFQYAAGQSKPASTLTTQLSGFTSFSTGSGGISLFLHALYDDAGTIKLKITDNNYPGGTIESVGSGTYLGRFIPDRFELIPEYSYVTNYVTDNDDSSHDFTYLGQDALVFDYQVKAVNMMGNITANYPFSDSTHSMRFFAENRPLDPNGNVTAEPLEEITGSIDIGTWSHGIYKGSAAGKLTRPDTDCLSASSHICGPYEKAYFGILMHDDNDPIILVGNDMYLDAAAGMNIATTISQTASRQLYGRWIIEDDYGPINQAFPVSMALEYYNGNQFVLNTDDSLTTFTATSAFATFDTTKIGVTGSGSFLKGESTGLIIDAHDNEGDVLLNYTAPTWLKYDWLQTGKPAQDPSAKITFGFYRGANNIIYRRQVN